MRFSVTLLLSVAPTSGGLGVTPPQSSAEATSAVVVPVVVEETLPPAPAGFDVAAELFAEDVIPEFDLELSEQALAALRIEPYVWVEGALTYRGVRYEPVGVHVKGNNSFLPIDEKPSLRVKLDHVLPGLDLLGIEELTFDNMSSDASMMRERVSYKLFREHGLPASRANHALVRINGVDRGLYALVESVDDEFLTLRYPDPSGALWELGGADFVERYIDEFESESGSDDPATLWAIADALEQGGDDVFDDVGAWVDWAQFVEFVAAASVVGQFDCYPWRDRGDDVHAYFDPADGRMDLVPHGMDETFDDDDHDLYANDGTRGLLFLTCLGEESCAADYDASLWDVQATSERIDLLGYALDVQAQISALAAADPARPYTLDEVEDAQEDVLEFIADRRQQLTTLTGYP